MAGILWHESHVKVAVLVSLSLQWLLLVLATFRKRTGNSFLSNLIFVVYLLSTKVAFATFYFIAGIQYFTLSKMPIGLWAAIMLLHLSGQERLSAVSSEDNEFWRRSTLNIVWQIFVHLGLFSLQKGFNHVPTLIMLCLAVSRIVFRACRLSMGTKEMMLFGSFLSDDSEIIPQGTTLSTDNDCQTVRQAHCLLKTSLHLLAESNCKSEVLNQVRESFVGIRDPNHAIRLIEIELNFMYESFHTDGTIRKHLNHYWSTMYAFLRGAEPILCVMALIFYLADSSNHLKSAHISRADYIVTNLLLWGTTFLEFISYIMTIFSDWTIAALCSFHCPTSNSLFQFVPHRRRWWSATHHSVHHNVRGWVKLARILCRRWSETISKFNFLSYSIKTRVPPHELQWEAYLPPLDTITGSQNLYTKFRFVCHDWYTDQLVSFIFQLLKTKTENTITSLKTMIGSSDETYKQEVLVWHIATDLLFTTSNTIEGDDEYREYSKILSNYMAYLLFMKPHFVPKSWFNPLENSKAAAARNYIQDIAVNFEGHDFESCLRTSGVVARHSCDPQEICKSGILRRLPFLKLMIFL